MQPSNRPGAQTPKDRTFLVEGTEHSHSPPWCSLDLRVSTQAPERTQGAGPSKAVTSMGDFKGPLPPDKKKLLMALESLMR